jgi:integrase
VLVGTGLRPEELFALERRDLDFNAGVIRVERVYTQRVLKEPKKSSRQRRRVPLRARVVESLRGLPPDSIRRFCSPLPAAATSTLRSSGIGRWAPALRAAGLEHRRVYDCRHTFASWAIAGGVQLFYLARIMGTSVAQIDATYGHLLPDSEDYLRGLLDDYDVKESAYAERR